MEYKRFVASSGLALYTQAPGNAGGSGYNKRRSGWRYNGEVDHAVVF